MRAASTSLRNQILRAARDLGAIWEPVLGTTAEEVAPQVEELIDGVDCTVTIEPALASYLPRVLLAARPGYPVFVVWADLPRLDVTRAAELADAVGPLARTYPATGCDGLHRGRCIRLQGCVRREHTTRWLPEWTGIVGGELVTAWEPEEWR